LQRDKGGRLALAREAAGSFVLLQAHHSDRAQGRAVAVVLGLGTGRASNNTPYRISASIGSRIGVPANVVMPAVAAALLIEITKPQL